MTLTYFWGHRGQFKHENLQFSLVNTITHQIIIALGPNLSHGCISGVSWLSLKMDELDLYVEVIGLISKLNLFHYKHDKHVTQSVLVALIPNLYHGCISSSKMDDLDLSFFVRRCMFMTSPHSVRRWIAWGAGNMHSSYYKWNMAIICNPPIMLCATFVPCINIIDRNQYCLYILSVTPWMSTLVLFSIDQPYWEGPGFGGSASRCRNVY